MDIEKLKSIIRLANNNPNENEANLAARKACKILAEDDFAIFKTTRTAADKIRSASNPASNSGIWADIIRSAEPAWRSQSYSGPGSPEARAYQERWYRQWNAYWTEAEKEPVPGKTEWDAEVRYKPFTGGQRAGKSAYNPISCPQCHWHMYYSPSNTTWNCANTACNYVMTDIDY